MPDLDGERVNRMLTPVMTVIRNHLRQPPHTQQKIYEALNALAMATAAVIAGTEGTDAEINRLREFFAEAADGSIENMRRSAARNGAPIQFN